MEPTMTGRTGLTDLMHAARAESARVRDAAKGDVVAEHEMLLDRLIDADLVRREDAGALVELYKLAFEAGEGKRDAARAFFEAREIYDKLAASGSASPVSVVIASAGLGSFELSADQDGAPTVTVYRQSYAQQGAAIGAGIGALLGGAAGALLGGEIGGLIGGIVDDKQDKGKGKGKT